MIERVLVNAVGATTGGAMRHLAPFLHALHHVRPAWQIVTTGYASTRRALPDSIRGVEIESTKFAGKGARLVWDGLVVDHWAKRRQMDAILHLANYGPFRCTVPSVLYQRNPIYFDPAWLPDQPLMFRCEAALRRVIAFRQISAADVTLTPSHSMRSFLLSWRPSGRLGTIRVVHHSVDSGRFAFKPCTINNRNHIKLLSVGHIEPQKDFSTAISALHILRENGLNASLTLTLAPDWKAHNAVVRKHMRPLIDQIALLALAPYINMVGIVDHVEELYRTHDIFINTSRTESFGFHILEAMASGIPVVASSIGPTLEILTDCGELFPFGDASRAADAVRTLLNKRDEDLLDQLQRARKRAETFTWERNASTVAETLESVASARRETLNC